MTTYPGVKVVGMHFRGTHAKEIAASLTPGDRLHIEREPENQFDANAIKVIHPPTEQFIGYIEATQAVWIASEIDNLEHISDGTPETQPLATVTVTGHEVERNNIYPIISVEISVGVSPDEQT